MGEAAAFLYQVGFYAMSALLIVVSLTSLWFNRRARDRFDAVSTLLDQSLARERQWEALYYEPVGERWKELAEIARIIEIIEGIEGRPPKEDYNVH